MAKFGKKNILKLLDEYEHPDAYGEYGSVALFQIDDDLLKYAVAVDYVDNGEGGNWTHAYSMGTEERARAAFLEETVKINERVKSEVALQHCDKTIKKQFRSIFWLEAEGKTVLCKNYQENASAGRQWRWGRLQSWLPKDDEQAKRIFTREVIKLAQASAEENKRVFEVSKRIIEQYRYLLLLEFEDEAGGFAVFEDGVENPFLAYFSKEEEKYARWAFESRKTDVNQFLLRLESQRLFEIKMERLKKRELKIIGFTSLSNEAIETMTCRAEETVAWTKTVEFIREHGLKFCGTHHQYGEDGMPVFSNGKKYLASMRTWGGIMAEAWNLESENEDGDDMAYCLWAWEPDETPILPKEKGIKVYEISEAVETEKLEIDPEGKLEIDASPSYSELQRYFAQEDYFKLPKVMTPEQFLQEFDPEIQGE